MVTEIKEQLPAAGKQLKGKRKEVVRAFLSSYSTLLVVIVLFIYFGCTSTYFFTSDNVLNIARQMSIVGVVAIGMTLVILIGGIDLSVGAVILLSSAISGTLISTYALPAWLAILAGLAAAAVVGLINGIMIEQLGISSVIVTLGTMIAVRGIGQAILWINNSWIWVTDPLFDSVAGNEVLFLPLSTAIMLGLYLIMAIILKQTSFGRFIYATGGNERAAFLSGLPVKKIKIVCYVLCAFFAGIAGLITAARTGVVNPTLGNGQEFDAITTVILGGASMMGGSGRLEKTLLGVVILVMVFNYLTLSGVPDVWQRSVTGFLVLAAVLLERVVRKSRET